MKEQELTEKQLEMLRALAESVPVVRAGNHPYGDLHKLLEKQGQGTLAKEGRHGKG